MIGPVPPMLPDTDERPVKRRQLLRVFVLFVGVAVAATGGWSWYASRTSTVSAESSGTIGISAENDSSARAPLGVRIRVRVVNTTRVDGLAKRATAVLRDRGYDVVDYEGDLRKQLDSTLVLTHTGHSDWSDRIVRALGAGKTELRPDTSRYLDVTVMLGSDWKAPTQPFRP